MARAQARQAAPASARPVRRVLAAALAAALLALCLCLASQAALPAVAALPAGAAPQDDQRNGDELVAVVPTNLPPLYYLGPEGAPTGFALEMLRQLAPRAGFSLRVITTSTITEAQNLLEQGKADVLPGLANSGSRAKRFIFSRPFETQPVHIFFRSESPAREDQAALAGIRVAVVEGSVPAERLRADPAIQLHVEPSLPQALFSLFSGGADALVFQSPLVEHAARVAGLEGRLARSRHPLFEMSRALALNAAQQDTLSRLDAALEQYRATPEFRALYREWHADPKPPLFPTEALWITAALLVALGGALLTWRYVSLLRMNRRLVAVLSERDNALSALRLTQDRLEALSALTHMDTTDTSRLIAFALDEGVRLTGSGIGFLFFVEGDTVDLKKIHWSLGGKAFPTEGVPDAYPLSETGLWGECVRGKAPVVVNDYPGSGRGNGLPPGHAPIQRFMSVPLVEAGKVTAVFGVANKPAPYDDNDTRQLQLFLSGLWRVLGARRDAEAIRQARDYAESLIEGANAMLVGLDTEGRVTLFNAAAEGITGYTRDEVLGRDWSAAILPQHLAEANTALYRDFIKGRASLPRQHRGVIRTRDGRQRHISWQNSLLKEGDQVTGIIAFGIDITEHKEAEAELRRLHRAIEQAAEGVLIADENGTILYANPSFQRMTGLDKDTPVVEGKSVFDLDVSVLEHHSSVIQGDSQEGTWRGTCAFARPAGIAAEVEFAVSAIRSRADRLVSYVAVCRDVTEKRQLEQQLWQAQKMEALGTLAGGIAHDFNNILASIMGFTELALDDIPRDSRARACLDKVLGASMRARELVRQILSFSRRSEQKLRHLKADAVVAEALKLIEASLPKAITVTAELASQASILADPSQIHQIVMNLCTNAAQAMKPDGGVLSVRTGTGPLQPELAARHRLPPGEYLTLTVEDQGPGITPDHIGRIFDPFFTTKGPGEGTGLGLAVVHGIVASLGGAVWAESEPGQGARFCVLLPTQSGREEAPKEKRQRDLRGRERILVVDDEPDLLEFCREALTPLGYEVRVQGDPQAALERLLASPADTDVLVTDMNMPRITGLQLAEGLRPVRPDMPVVLITGFSRAIPPDRLESLGAVRLLSKPFSTGELALAVRQALAQVSGGEK